jgi:hypothetical protein
MHRPVRALLLVLLIGGCNEVTSDLDPADGRPLDLVGVTFAVFQPSCGQAQCHSKFHGAGGLVFDNPEDVRHSLHLPSGEYQLLRFDSDRDDREWSGFTSDQEMPKLMTWLTATDPFGRGIGRMPFDAPLAERDLELLVGWIRSPQFGVGAEAMGAQCDPDLYNGLACNGSDLYTCTPDGNWGEMQRTCNTCTIAEAGDKFVLQCN